MMKPITAIEVVTRGAGVLSALLILPLIAALVIEVFSRYLLDSPTLWAFEISYMVMGAIFMLAIANALRLGQHVTVDVVSLRLSRRTNAAIQCCCYLLFLPLSGWLSWELVLYFHEALETGERSGRSAWNPLMWPVYSVWAVGFLILTLQLLAELIKAFYTLMGMEDRLHNRSEQGAEHHG